MSVLLYVKNENKPLSIFVANRVSIIRDGSTPDQWRQVEGAVNPGDLYVKRNDRFSLAELWEMVNGSGVFFFFFFGTRARLALK